MTHRSVVGLSDTVERPALKRRNLTNRSGKEVSPLQGEKGRAS